jgi:preprotein translocase subunit SecA
MAFTLKDKFLRGLNRDRRRSRLDPDDEARTPSFQDRLRKHRPTRRSPARAKAEASGSAGGSGRNHRGSDFIVDERTGIELTERGHAFVEDELGGLIVDRRRQPVRGDQSRVCCTMHQLRAHNLFKLDVDYMV